MRQLRASELWLGEAEAVAETTNRVKLGGIVRVRLDLLAKAADVDGQNFFGPDFAPEKMIENLLFGDSASEAAGQKDQKLELLVRQACGVVVDDGVAQSVIDEEPPDPDLLPSVGSPLV
jgi:hypothetical protein